MMSWIHLSVSRRCSSVLALVAAGAIPLAAWSQGPLLPAGAPAPTMKTLDQVEPRIPISSLPFSINLPGSYYLTTNLTGTAGANGITILAGDVTVDLEGFALVGVSGSLAGIHVPSSQKNLEIRNGVVRAWGQQGIDTGPATTSRLLDVRVSGNGGNGIEVNGCTVTDCIVTENEGAGIVVGTASIVSGCRLIENEIGGIQVGERSVIEGNVCSENFDYGIQATGVDNRIVDNHVATHTIGLDLDAADNYVAGNTVVDNLKNYDCVPGNQLNLLLWEIPESIDWPASVKLAGTLTGRSGQDGITINADDVTIDLNGHSLVGVPGSLSGIHIPTAIENIEIRNGTVRAWGHYGINAVLADNCRFLNLQAFANGFGTPFTYGLQAGPRSMIRGCTASGNASFGIAGGTASIIDGCVSGTNGVTGIRAFNCTVTDCSSSDNLGPGIHADASTVTDCTAQGNAGGGIRVSDNSTLKGNRCVANGGSFGIRATSSGNRIENNHVLDQAIGLDLDAGGNTVAGNTVHGNTDNYDIVAGNQLKLLLCELPESIDWPASVKLNGSLTGTAGIDGITVTANDVTIDLAQHVLQGVGGVTTSDGVYALGVTNLVVRNGGIHGWGGYGVLLNSGSAEGFGNVVEDISARNNGVIGIGCLAPYSEVRRCEASGNGFAAAPGFGHGFRVGSSGLVDECVARGNRDDGITVISFSIVKDCRSASNGEDGIFAFASRLERCVATNNGNSGLRTQSLSSVLESKSSGNGLYGIVVDSRAAVRGCVAHNNDVGGILMQGDDALVVDSQCLSNTDVAGIRVLGSGNRIEGNASSNNGFGLAIESAGNLIIRNSVSGNSTNFAIVAGNTEGPTVTSATIAGSTNPHANYEH